MNNTSASQRLNLTIEGMSCGHCVQAVTRALEATPGISVLSVTPGEAQVETSSPDSTAAALAAIEEAGYRASAAQSSGSLTGSSCGCCSGASSPKRRH
jgi:copper chaperone CopZ